MTENVWDYPRPPRLEPVGRRVRIVLGGETIVDTDEALRVLETSHPPTVYVPPGAFADGVLQDADGSSYCEWKGVARYHDLTAGGRTADRAGWSYPRPTKGFLDLRDHVSVYPSRMDACWLDDERVQAQEGDFYGGWITEDLVGPFKGGPGTRGW
ncbi:DUF427 domain-containing protein [Patulibacter sp.]|uniref:DUF427 domain-containing protein n=1 Tax=Patulibacter sp. TaxID=1912859 RepID=UPI002720CB26|nr:DUF427 domain-containing protein [Patulibacter sp.]MDO9408268.1 DUF427 domain-containing protein [Patulibacter sp.]